MREKSNNKCSEVRTQLFDEIGLTDSTGGSLEAHEWAGFN